MVASYEEAVQLCLAVGKPTRFLYVFIKSLDIDPATEAQMFDGQKSDKAGYLTVAFDAHEPVAPDLTFDRLVAQADKRDATWDMIAVSFAHNGDGSEPSAEQAEHYLADIRRRLLSGETDGFFFFNRAGQPLELSARVIQGRSAGDYIQ